MAQVNGFYGHIRRNDTRSIVMFAGFLLACQLIGLAILVGPLILFDDAYDPVTNFTGYLRKYGLIVLGLSTVLFFVRLFLHVRNVRNSVHFRLISVQEEPRLYKIIEMQAIAAGISMPGVGIIENDARNAFACGMSEKSAVVVVTRGLLWALDDEELEAVVAHEITHIVNGDIRLMAVANVMLSTLFLLKKNNPIRIEDGKQIFLIIVMPPMLILFLLSGIVTSVAMTIGKLSRLLIASSREFIADAEAVRMTKNPAALISALQKIGGYSTIVDLDETIDAMMIDGAVEGAYASHPTIAERIAVLSKHAGAMVTGPRTRKDTRNSLKDFGIASDGTFGQARPAVQMTTVASKKLLIDRVNVGSGENAFGLSQKMRTYVLLAVAGVALFSYWNVKSFESTALNLNGLRSDINKPFKNPGFQNLSDIGSEPGKLNFWASQYNLGKQLGRMDAQKARCFSARGYSVGDRGRHEFTLPDTQLVTDYFIADRMPSDVKVEKYAALRFKSHREVKNANSPADLDKALTRYISQRESLLVILHRFFGEEGLQWMLAEYQSDRDRNIVSQIRKRLQEGAVLGKTKRDRGEVALLVKNSKDFIPCYYRAGLEQEKRQLKPVKQSASGLRQSL